MEVLRLKLNDAGIKLNDDFFDYNILIFETATNDIAVELPNDAICNKCLKALADVLSEDRDFYYSDIENAYQDIDNKENKNVEYAAVFDSLILLSDNNISFFDAMEAEERALQILNKKHNTTDFDFSFSDFENLESGETDFESEDGNYRIIDSDYIDEIQQEELANDDYMLGCFNSSFLADVLGIDMDVIEIMQKAEAFEAIGKLVKSLNKLEELQEEYARLDGYGHHFAHYDGNENEITFNNKNYYVFRIN